MERLKIFLLLLSFIFCFTGLKSQSVLTINEITEEGKSFITAPITKVSAGGVATTLFPNVDINSNLIIKINTAGVKAKGAEWIGVQQNIPYSRMQLVADVLLRRKELLDKINLGVEADFTKRVDALDAIANDLLPIIDFIDSLPPGNSFKIKVNKIFSERGNGYNNFFDALQQEIDDINISYQKSIESNKIYFRLAAFINKTPVHLEGFDVYKEGEIYRVPRFATSIDPEEKKKFDEYKTLADKANNEGVSALNNIIKGAADVGLNRLKDSIELKLSAPFSQFKSGLDTLTSLSADIKLKLEESEREIDQLIATLKLTIDIANNVDDVDYELKLAKAIQNLSLKLVQVKLKLENTITEIQKGIPAGFKGAYDNFKKAFESCKDTLINMSVNLTNFFDHQMQLNFGINKKIAESLLKLGNEVKKLPLDNIPEATNLNLITSAHREEGDRLYLKAVLGRQTPDSISSEEKTIEYIPIGLYKIELHSSINALLIFADNITTEYPANTQFQLNPAYSVLFKYGSRTCNAYNNYFKIGAGLNMATLDFNNDNTPEIGIGIVVSGFRDYLQLGYGRNMSIDKSYWFFGIRLPFLGVDLSGGAKLNSPEK